MFPGLIKRVFEALPSQCMVCRAWPAQTVCEACVNRFAQPQPRCQTCALPVPAGVRQCGVCVKTPPPLDACLAAVSYAYPWSDLIVGYKFHDQPGWASAFALLLRSAPWVEPALDAASMVLPMPLSRVRLQTRGFNQALVLARQLAPTKTDSRLLLRIKDTPPQSALKRAERLSSVKDAFAVEPLRLRQVKGARLVLVDDVMTSGASLFAAARVLRAAGAAHITGLVIARTDMDP
ncbi:ComF family protein [Rhodoferax ferrireducens]|uniref:ComF family protein n=1 Tax=Rhodoferax ferrireducens TaxID=192843 RepID=UPI000E0DB449|nr:ComF family protein [Rhodoferax ferrireducens]